MKTQIEQILREFEEKFTNIHADCDGGGIVWNDRLGQDEIYFSALKSFLLSSLTQAIAEALAEARPEEKAYSNEQIIIKDFHAPLTPMASTYQRILGYNSALADYDQKVREILKEMIGGDIY